MNLEQLKAAAQAVVDAESAITYAIIALSAEAFDEIVEQRKRTLSEAIYALGKALKNDLETSCGWQPIETAPKDGTQYLAWNGLSCMVLNQPDESFAIGEWELVDGEWIGHHVGHHPTHWQQLPTPPEKNK